VNSAVFDFNGRKIVMGAQLLGVFEVSQVVVLRGGTFDRFVRHHDTYLAQSGWMRSVIRKGNEYIMQDVKVEQFMSA